ncbi:MULTISPECIES: hypothetical protein [Chryseobacterium]|jgi:hypothetical protein|uniref:Carboxypeptidase regulatory-like domain-containing protein n=1 Tax=Chryseobacterium lathyri TaxID=395933 RepID=A0A511Y723_9FLAO|nr:hypothetical protein [Chryseobacterium lathyri]GEN70984.1 hypothetical protein CLA01_10560 [Chryseobacterium lathyri]
MKKHYYIIAFFLLSSIAGAQSFTVEQKAQFNKSETIQLMTGGKSTIKGQAFAKDNQSGIRGIAVLNINKRQYAPKGTSIIVMPQTAYFKEWQEVSKKYEKEGKIVELHKEARACIKVIQVKDDKGSFEINNLMPGQYLLITGFNYIQDKQQTYTLGYENTYINNTLQSSREIEGHHYFKILSEANIRKSVTIKKDGDVEDVNLRMTL